MARNSVLCSSSSTSCLIPSLFVLLCFFGHSYSYDQQIPFNTFIISSFSYPPTTLRAFDLRYIRVELPPWFSSMSLAMHSDVDLGIVNIEKVPKSRLPIICFRGGSPPLPDVNGSLKDSGNSGKFDLVFE